MEVRENENIGRILRFFLCDTRRLITMAFCRSSGNLSIFLHDMFSSPVIVTMDGQSKIAV